MLTGNMVRKRTSIRNIKTPAQPHTNNSHIQNKGGNGGNDN